MRRFKYIVLFLIFQIILFSCKKDGWNPPKTGDYFTCLVNGERFETKYSFYCSGRSFYYYSAGTAGLDDSYLLAKGVNCDTGEGVTLRMKGLEPQAGYYNVLDTLLADSVFPAYNRGTIFYDQLQSGYIQIDEFSPRDGGQGEFGNFAGSFEFAIMNDTLDTVIHITEGQFRFAVPNIW
ncbi:hypothetical protein O3Q51_12690 [Cryomorphaceae bacterium 1068]|nr:hypothetical protein [Cryomorphaceae bacterium 1068]